MRLLFENGGRGGMRDAEAVAGGLGLWSPPIGALYAEVGPQNSAWWSDPSSPQPVLLRAAADLVDLVKGADLDALGAALWAEAEALALSAEAKPGAAGRASRI